MYIYILFLSLPSFLRTLKNWFLLCLKQTTYYLLFSLFLIILYIYHLLFLQNQILINHSYVVSVIKFTKFKFIYPFNYIYLFIFCLFKSYIFIYYISLNLYCDCFIYVQLFDASYLIFTKNFLLPLYNIYYLFHYSFYYYCILFNYIQYYFFIFI